MKKPVTKLQKKKKSITKNNVKRWQTNLNNCSNKQQMKLNYYKDKLQWQIKRLNECYRTLEKLKHLKK